ncbi:DUF2512 family protein [Heliobacterium chlorum]|uniref:DUF2512 family protein n=1 Tax=Heliobacterium chlorum TaxID=2698 RepID=A0ABR7T6H3_HELCL|nr:DUF2512 family protein [Heliobacterium chlorum]MBC9785166.1 DUF2512 family protein [Heliobacterium chlorum]
MNRTSMALGMKFLMTLIASGITLGFLAGNSWGRVILFSVLATGLNYLIGDLMVLPRMGNLIASIGDGLLAAITAYSLTFLLRDFYTTTFSLLSLAVLVAIGESLFHIYLRRDEKVMP